MKFQVPDMAKLSTLEKKGYVDNQQDMMVNKQNNLECNAKVVVDNEEYMDECNI